MGNTLGVRDASVNTKNVSNFSVSKGIVSRQRKIRIIKNIGWTQNKTRTKVVKFSIFKNFKFRRNNTVSFLAVWTAKPVGTTLMEKILPNSYRANYSVPRGTHDPADIDAKHHPRIGAKRQLGSSIPPTPRQLAGNLLIIQCG
jgi:hypothetical protein